MRTGFLTAFSRYQDKTPQHSLNPGLTHAQNDRLSAWRNGRTGIAMPDAAMQELGATAGFEHEPWLWFANPLPAPLIDHKAAFREARARWGKQDDVFMSRDDVRRTHDLF